VRRERLVLTLPPDPAYARLTRLTTGHFLRQHGRGVEESRRDARRVETRMKGALKSAGRTELGKAVELVMTSSARALEIELVRGRSARARLLQLPHEGDGR
jgi:hypothetical protein